MQTKTFITKSDKDLVVESLTLKFQNVMNEIHKMERPGNFDEMDIEAHKHLCNKRDALKSNIQIFAAMQKGLSVEICDKAEISSNLPELEETIRSIYGGNKNIAHALLCSKYEGKENSKFCESWAKVVGAVKTVDSIIDDNFGITELLGHINDYNKSSELTGLYKKYFNSEIDSICKNIKYGDALDEIFSNFSNLFIDVYNKNGAAGLILIYASIFRNHFAQFPLIYLNGAKGTGKSAFLNSINKILINEEISSINLEIIEEYIPNLDTKTIEKFKFIYDSIDKDREKAIESRKIFFISSQIFNSDPAITSRSIVLNFDTFTFSNEQQKKFNDLKIFIEENKSYINILINRKMTFFRLNYNQNFDVALNALKSRFYIETTDNRLIFNWSIILAIFLTMKQVIPIDITYNDMETIIVEQIIYQQNIINSLQTN